MLHAQIIDVIKFSFGIETLTDQLNTELIVHYFWFTFMIYYNISLSYKYLDYFYRKILTSRQVY